MKRCSIYFLNVLLWKKIIKEIEAIFNRSGLTTNIEIKELNIMLGQLYGSEDLDVIFNTVILISKWEIWKIRNKVECNQSRIGDQTTFNTCNNNFKKHLQCTLKTSQINEIDKSKWELFRNNIWVFVIYEHKANAW